MAAIALDVVMLVRLSMLVSLDHFLELLKIPRVYTASLTIRKLFSLPKEAPHVLQIDLAFETLTLPILLDR